MSAIQGLLFPELAVAVKTPSERMRPWGDSLGKAEVRALEADGWAFADGGVKLADCWAVWSQRGEELKLRWLACPEKYPEAWA